MDFGFGSDPSFVVKLFVFPEKKQIYIANEASGRVTMDQLPHMVRSVTREDGDRVCCDSSQPGTIEFLQSRGINAMPAKKGPGSVKSGILFLQGFEIIIDPNCEKMQEEAHLYIWMTDKLTNQALSTPVDAFQPWLGCDALCDRGRCGGDCVAGRRERWRSEAETVVA